MTSQPNPDGLIFDGIIDGVTGEPVRPGYTPKVALGTPQRGAEATGELFLGYIPVPAGATAEWWGTRIESVCVPRTGDSWQKGIADVPEGMREAVRAYLRGRWRILEDRARRNREGGKRSERADQIMADLAKRYGKRE